MEKIKRCLQSNLIIVFFSTVTPTENVSRSAPEEETTGSLTSLFMEFDVIAQATNNFSDEIGSGGFAKVYKVKSA